MKMNMYICYVMMVGVFVFGFGMGVCRFGMCFGNLGWRDLLIISFGEWNLKLRVEIGKI